MGQSLQTAKNVAQFPVMMVRLRIVKYKRSIAEQALESIKLQAEMVNKQLDSDAALAASQITGVKTVLKTANEATETVTEAVKEQMNRN